MNARFAGEYMKIARCLFLALFATALHAAEPVYPAKPIRLVVPYAAGGSTDTLIRMIGPELAEKLGKTVPTIGLTSSARGPSRWFTSGRISRS